MPDTSGLGETEDSLADDLSPLYCVILWENNVGMSIFGPFDDQAQADQWCHDDAAGDYMVVPMSDPGWEKKS